MANKRSFPGISPQAFEHPLDRTALITLQKVPGLDRVIQSFLATIGQRRLRLLFLASAVRVGEWQFPRVNTLLREACEILDIDDPPELFISQQFALNAAAIGVERPFIVVTSSMLEMMDDEELRCVIGHELGHIVCGHALYTTMLVLLIRVWQFFLGIPGGIYAVIAIRLALLEWSRKAELTADRAGLLVSQDPEVSYRVDMKLAGGRRDQEMNPEALMDQVEEYEAGGDLLDGILKLALVAGQTHPFPVLRVAELRKWVASGEYDAIMRGKYIERAGDGEDAWLEGVTETASRYQEAFDATADPLLSTLRDMKAGASAAGAEVVEFIRRAMRVDDGRSDE